jgi:hypothetical protein
LIDSRHTRATAVLVLGRIAQFWKLINDPIPRIDNTQEFLAFNNPSYAKAVMNFYVHRNHADDEDIKFSTETRIYIHDQIVRKKFARYWFVIQSFSAFNRKMRAESSKAAIGDSVIIWRKARFLFCI